MKNNNRFSGIMPMCINGAFAIFATASVAYSQPEPPQPPPPPSRHEKIEAQKIAFITDFLDLSTEEAQVFWPVYNKFQKEQEAMRKVHREEIKSAKKDFEQMGDKEVEAMVDREMEFRQKMLDLQKQYHLKLKGVLPIKKVAKLYHAEKLFKRHLLERLKQRQDNMRTPPMPPPPGDAPEDDEE